MAKFLVWPCMKKRESQPLAGSNFIVDALEKKDFLASLMVLCIYKNIYINLFLCECFQGKGDEIIESAK